MKEKYSSTHNFLLVLLIIAFSESISPSDYFVESFKSIIRKATLIAEFEVLDIKQSNDEHNTPIRIITLKVGEIIIGNSEDQIIMLRIPILDNENEKRALSPLFIKGERVILPLIKYKTGEFVIIGHDQGKYQINGNTIEGSNISVIQFKKSIQDIYDRKTDLIEVPAKRKTNADEEFGDYSGEGISKLDGEFHILDPLRYGPTTGTITFLINPSNAKDKDGNALSFEDIYAAISRAINTWNTVNHSSITFSVSSSKTSNSRIRGDGYSTITFEGDQYLGSNGITSVIPTEGGVINEVDIAFNSDNRWNTNSTYPSSYSLYSHPRLGYIGPVDLEDVAAHELGHGIGLNHVGDSYSSYTMYPSTYEGTNWWEKTWRRSLETGDAAGKVYLDPSFQSLSTQSIPKLLLSARTAIDFYGDFIVPSGCLLTLESGKTINLNNNSILSSGGTITNQGAKINGLKVYCKTGSNIYAYYGYYPSIQDVLNKASIGQIVGINPGVCNINSNLSVPAGITLQINSGVYLYFYPGTQLTVSGTLLADYATFNCSEQGESWNGIKLIGTSNSHIKNCSISNFGSYFGTDGIYIQGGSPNIEFNEIVGGGYNGIKVYGGSPLINYNKIDYIDNGNGITVENNSSPVISNNTISHTYYHGISVYGVSAHVTINNNTLSYCGYQTRTYIGLRAYNSTSIDAIQNTIQNSCYGVLSDGYSIIDFGSPYGPNAFLLNNKIKDCSYGLVAYNHSNIIAGRFDLSSGGYLANNNIIEGTVNNALQASLSSGILAQMNYFGGGDPVCVKDAGSSITWQPKLTTQPPFVGSSLAGDKVTPANIGTINYSLTDAGIANNTAALDAKSFNDDSNIMQALLLINSKEYSGAKNILKGFIEKGSDRALTPMVKLFFESKDNDLRAMLENAAQGIKESQLKDKYKEALLRMYYGTGEYKLSLRVAEELIAKGNKEAMVDKFLIYALGFRDIKNALSVLNDIKTNIGKENADELYTLLLPDQSDEITPGMDKLIFKRNSDETLTRPSEYLLSQNYPNPFNPSTIISYQIPVSGKVTLKIYDMLGKEVDILENGYKEMGKYSVRFNASGLPSGSYIYELRANDFSKCGKMVLLK